MTSRSKSSLSVETLRFVSSEQSARLQAKQPVTVEYIPGEWNTERFPGDDGGATPWFIAFAVFLALLVYTIRKPSAGSATSSGASPQSGLSAGAAWLLRGALLVTALGAIVGGGAGLMGGAGSVTGNAVLLAIGIALMGVFWLALRLRIA